MPIRMPASPAATAREKIFWGSIAALAAAQLTALWMLCSYQVRQAQAREATVQVERMALADCLRYIAGSTPHHCAARLAVRHDPNAVLAATENTAHFGAPASAGRAAHVNFSLR